MTNFLTNTLPKWIILIVSLIVLVYVIGRDSLTNKFEKNLQVVYIGIPTGLLAIYALFLVLYKPENTCKPSDDERKLAGGKGALTFKNITTCGAASCDTGYILTDTGICVKKS